MKKHAKRRGTKGTTSTADSADAAKKGRPFRDPSIIRAPRVSEAISRMAAPDRATEPEVKKTGRKWSEDIIRRPHGSMPFDAAGMDTGYQGVSDPGRENEAISQMDPKDTEAIAEAQKGKLLGDARRSAMNDQMSQSNQAAWDQLRTKIGGANAANVSTAKRK